MIGPLRRDSASSSKSVETQGTSDAVTALQTFIDILDRGAIEELTHLFEDSAEVIFEDAFMNISEYIEEMVRACRAFPDLKFKWKSVKAEGDNKAVIRGLQAQGTHQRPYGFGPYPPIEATQIKCTNDPEDVIVWMGSKGKISKAQFIPKGELTGPPGFYTQIGGLIF